MRNPFEPGDFGFPTGAVLGLLVGLGLGWFMWHPQQVSEVAAPSILLPGGGHVLERKPDAPVPAPIKQAAKEQGAKPVRAGSVSVKPAPAADSGPGCSCAEFSLDWGLLREKDGQRMVFTAPAGVEITGGVDIPLEPMSARRQLRWAAGVSYSTEREFGAWVDRDLGPLRLGVEVQKRRLGGVTAVARLGFRF